MFPGQCHTDQQWYQRTLESQGYAIPTLVLNNCCATFFGLVKEIWIYFNPKKNGHKAIWWNNWYLDMILYNSSIIHAQEQVDSRKNISISKAAMHICLLSVAPFIFPSWCYLYANILPHKRGLLKHLHLTGAHEICGKHSSLSKHFATVYWIKIPDHVCHAYCIHLYTSACWSGKQ